MTNKILAQATSELIIENPSDTSAILDRLRILIATKYRGISWQKFAQALLEQIAQHEDIDRFTVSSATPLSDNQKQALMDKLGKDNDYSWRVNEHLLGGLVLTRKDEELDLSLKKKLQLIANSLKDNHSLSQ